jgi:hypothetical protein
VKGVDQETADGFRETVGSVAERVEPLKFHDPFLRGIGPPDPGYSLMQGWEHFEPVARSRQWKKA